MNVFELFASLKLDDKEFEKGLTEAEKNAHKVGEGIGNALKGGASLVGGAVKGVGVVAAGAAAAITPLVKNAVDAYGETQQLVGGIETLFGTGGKSLEEYAASVGKSVDEARKITNKQIADEYEQIRLKEAGCGVRRLVTVQASRPGELGICPRVR